MKKEIVSRVYLYRIYKSLVPGFKQLVDKTLPKFGIDFILTHESSRFWKRKINVNILMLGSDDNQISRFGKIFERFEFLGAGSAKFLL